MRYLTDQETFVCDISGGMGGCPPPVSPPVSPPPTPAIPALIGTPPGALPGSQWIESAEQHYIAQGGAEYGGTGTAVSTPPGALAGSIHEEAENKDYVDASGVRRRLQANSLGAKAGPAIQGSEWIESTQAAGKQFEWIGGTNKLQWWNGGV